MTPNMTGNERYSRQIILDKVGEAGQARLSEGCAVVMGCGALGGVIATNIVRAGIGRIRLVDRDIVELNNLQRQTLFSEPDIGKPKAWVAAQKLRHVNSAIEIEAVVADVNHSNIEGLVRDADVVLDGTDNMETRYLVNDVCVKYEIPWVYGGAIGTYGMVLTIIPHSTPCLRCVFPELPQAGALPTCDTAGVLNTIPPIIASIECTEAFKVLLGKEVEPHLLSYDVWRHECHTLEVVRDEACRCCVKHDFEFLNAKKRDTIISLCGRDAVQITPISKGTLSFERLVDKLSKLGTVEASEFLLKFKPDKYELNIFKDGRTIVHGTSDAKVARSLYAKYVGT